jgi:cell division septation protein DedD
MTNFPHCLTEAEFVIGRWSMVGGHFSFPEVDPVRPSSRLAYYPPERKKPMEETNTTWKNHSFTLLVFGGIVALSFIFFVLGMLVGRNQGQRLAEIAYAEKAAKNPVADPAEDEFKQNFYTELTEEKPDSKLQPAPESTEPITPLLPVPTPATPAPAVAKSASTGPTTTTVTAPPLAAKPDPAAKAGSGKIAATAKPAVALTTTASKTRSTKEVFLQVTATKNEKQASQVLKNVESKGFRGKILAAAPNSGQLHRVVVGPYKESEVNLAKSDLAAKGYKGAFVTK